MKVIVAVGTLYVGDEQIGVGGTASVKDKAEGERRQAKANADAEAEAKAAAEADAAKQSGLPLG
jgi:hypothetical protein